MAMSVLADFLKKKKKKSGIWLTSQLENTCRYNWRSPLFIEPQRRVPVVLPGTAQLSYGALSILQNSADLFPNPLS